MNHEFNLVIIGGGCIGSSILYELSMKYPSLALIDNGRNTLSATSHSGGMLRVFHESEDHVDLALGNHHRLKQLEQNGVLSPGQTPNGNLYFFNKERFNGYSHLFKKMNEAQYPFEILTQHQGHSRFPEFNWSADEWAVYEPLAGHRNPIIQTNELLNKSHNSGVHLFEDHEVIRICPYLDRFRIYCDKGVITANSLILAGGARLLPRLGDLRLSFPLEKKSLQMFIASKNDHAFTLPNFFDRETLAFGRMGPGENVILSEIQTTRLKEKHWAEDFIEQTMDDCYAPNRMGIAGVVPGHKKLIMATGWGGTAFKFSLEIGRKVAQYA